MNLTFWPVFVVLSLLLAIAAAFTLLNQRYLRITSLGWLLAIVFIPMLGSLSYFLVVARSHSKREEGASCALPFATQELTHVERDDTLAQLHGFERSSAIDELDVLVDEQFLPAVLKAINEASRSIAICTYILRGESKKKVLDALSRASERGVSVFCLVDRLGSGLFRSYLFSHWTFRSQPFQTALYHGSAMRTLLFIEKRLHSKMVIIDGERGFIGAHNLRDETHLNHEAFVHNLSLDVKGDVVRQMLMTFNNLWRNNAGDTPKALIEELRLSREAKPISSETLTSGRVFWSDPLIQASFYHDYLNALFFNARKRIYIWMPYVIPSQVMRSNVIAAHRLGMDVKVLMPKKTDSFVVDNAHALVINEWADAGVPVALSGGFFDHSKVLIIDERVIVGSTNLDYRSLHRNHETSIEFYSCSASQTIERAFLQRFKAAECVRLGQVPFWKRTFQQATSLIAGLY